MASLNDVFALPDIGENKRLAIECADVGNWEWSENCKKGWTKAKDDWQQFFAKWRTASECESLANPDYPKFNRPPLDEKTAPEVIFVRKSYVTMFNRIWSIALERIPTGAKTGVLITGQPGCGKSVFLYYLLVRLLQQNQVVLFTGDGNELFLFFGNTVYSTTLTSQTGKLHLPTATSSSSKIFIWSLFDISTKTEPQSPLLDRRCFPVQSASPDPSRYQVWSKEWRPVLVGFPRWTREELAQGLKCQLYYDYLVTTLHQIYSKGLSQPAVDPKNLLRVFPGAYEILQERYGVEEELEPTATGALDTLLDAAIWHFGYVARDVFDAIKDFDNLIKVHNAALAINHSSLKTAVATLVRGEYRSDSLITYRNLIIHAIPSANPLSSDGWELAFKSDWITKNVLKVLEVAGEVEIRRTISFFRQMQATAPLASSFLELLAHRQLAGASKTTEESWPLTRMQPISDTPGSPTFVSSHFATDYMLPKIEREVLAFSLDNFPATIEQNKYYKPDTVDFPLFDAFTVEFDYSKNLLLLSLLQMTSRSHGASALGYKVTRKIVATLKKQLQDIVSPPKIDGKPTAPGTLVEVRYILVNPRSTGDPPQEKKWQFPSGWDKGCDHCSRVYWLEVVITV